MEKAQEMLSLSKNNGEKSSGSSYRILRALFLEGNVANSLSEVPLHP